MIRWANNQDGWAIAALMKTCGYDSEGLDWTDIEPHWIVSEDDGLIVGCIQVAYSKPMAHLAMIGVDPRLGGHKGGKILRDLMTGAIAMLQDYKAQSVLGFVSFDRKGNKRFYQKHGAAILTQGHLMELRLPRSSDMPSRSNGEVRDGRRQGSHDDSAESPADRAAVAAA